MSSLVEKCRNEKKQDVAKLNMRYLNFTSRTKVETDVGDNLMSRMMEEMNAQQKKVARRKDIGCKLVSMRLAECCDCWHLFRHVKNKTPIKQEGEQLGVHRRGFRGCDDRLTFIKAR